MDDSSCCCCNPRKQVTTCPKNLQTWVNNPLDRPQGEMNWTSGFQNSRVSNASLDNCTQLLYPENVTILEPETNSEGLSSGLGAATMALSGSIGIVVFILLLVGLLSVTLKKWRHERLFKKQLRHQTNFLYNSSDLSCPAEAIYSNMINPVPWKEDEFAVYANVPCFDRPRWRPSPDQVEYTSIIFH